MYEKQALKCQDDISSYPYVSQEIWANKNDIGEKNSITSKFLLIQKYVIGLLWTTTSLCSLTLMKCSYHERKHLIKPPKDWIG